MMSETKPAISMHGLKPGNVFHLVNRAAKSLRNAGLDHAAADLLSRIIKQDNVKWSYEETLDIVREYVAVVEELDTGDDGPPGESGAISLGGLAAAVIILGLVLLYLMTDTEAVDEIIRRALWR